MITTPESLAAILIGKKMREHLKNVRFVVVDEIHELVENKRGTQLSLLLERLELLSPGFQRVALSATIGSPDKVAEFIKASKIVKADEIKSLDINVELPEAAPQDKKISDDLFVGESTATRIRRLHELISQHASVLTFTNTRQMAEILSSRLREYDKELAQQVHHSSLSKESRVSSEQDFKKQKLKALVCTSSLELGIDIGSIDLVIQYMSSRQVSKLVQRIGRSGHGIGRTSKGIIISDTGDDLFESTVIAKHALKSEIEPVDVHELAWDVLAIQIAGFALEEYDISSDKIFDTLKKAYPFRHMKKPEFERVLKSMVELRLIWLNPDEFGEGNANNKPKNYKIRRNRKTWEYYYENLSTIPDIWRYRVISIVEHEPVGFLDEEFVAEHGEPGNTFICRGRAWRILNVDGDKIMVEPTESIESAVPAWEGELIPVPYEVASDVGRTRTLIAGKLKDKKHLLQELQRLYPIKENAAREMVALVEKQSKHFVPDSSNWLVETYQDFIIIHTCSGSLANDTLGRYLASMITNEFGFGVQLKIDPYRIILKSPVKAEKIVSYLKEISDLELVLTRNIERSSLFKWRFIHTAKRSGIMSRKVRFSEFNLSKIVQMYSDSPAYDETLREILHDKMDVAKSEEIADKIKSGKIKLRLEKGLSALGEYGLMKQFSDIMMPMRPEHEIFRAFKRRLLHTSMQLVCTHCKDYHIIQEVSRIDEQPLCPKCNSGLIAVISKFDRSAIKLLKSGAKTSAEKKQLEAIKRSASLCITYGKRYAFVAAARGVGAETAARILAKMPKDEEQLLKYIFDAERQYQRTKKYWAE